MTWRRAPFSVWLFIALMPVMILVAALPGDPVIGSWPVAAVLTLLWTALLLGRSSWGWYLIVAVYAIATAVTLGLTVWPWNLTLTLTALLSVASLVLLLVSPTRRWVGVSGRA